MQENNFEQTARQTLDGLEFTPSDPVWQKIETRIKKKQERRRVLWLLPLLFLSGGLAWWMLAPLPQTPVANGAQTRTSLPVTTFSKPHVSSPAQPAKPLQPVASAENNLATTIAKKRLRIEEAIVTEQKSKWQTARTPASQLEIQTHVAETKIISGLEDISWQAAAGVAWRIPQVVIYDEERLEKRFRRFSFNNIGTPPANAAEQKQIILKTDSITASPAVVKASRKWHWRATGRIGAADISGGLFSLPANKSSRVGNVLFSNMASFDVTLSRPDTMASRQLSSPTHGIHASVGGVLKKFIGRNTYFNTGLQYSVYSNRAALEQQLPADPVAESLYNTAQTGYRNTRLVNRFRNVFHYAEVPLGLEHQLLRKRPLFFQYGMVITQLVAGRAASYNSATNRYNYNAMALRKTGFSMYASLGYTVWRSGNAALQAGPHVQYGLRNLYKQATVENHLVSGGVAVNMAF